MRVRPVAMIVIIVSLLVMTACGSAARSPEAGASAGGSSAPGSFVVPTLAGGTFDGASLAGKPALLWFWAPWCPTCAGQAATVRGLADTYQGKVTVLGVAGLDKRDQMNEFVTMFKLQNMTHLADEEGVVWRQYEITTQSVYVLLDAAGKVLHSGRLDNDVVTERVAALATA